MKFSPVSLVAFLALSCSLVCSAAPKPIKALFLTGGGYHDYPKLAPHLVNSFGQRVNVTMDIDFTMDRLKNPDFAKNYDVVVYDMCWDDAETVELQNALNTIKAGKPAVMIHCAVHAFRNNKIIHDWEAGVGMRSKVHDPHQPFSTINLDPKNPILAGWPDDWKTSDDELYNTIEFPKTSHALLKSISPKTGKEHIVCWTQTFGKGRVFATTLGHDMHTAENSDYLGLIARGLLWSCDKLDKKGNAKKGYGK